MIKVKEAKEIREQFNYTHLVIFGIDESGAQHVATHGKSKENANQASTMGNHLKEELNWPVESRNAKALERACANCDYWQRGDHRPGGRIEENEKGHCMFNPIKIPRFEKDLACGQFLPTI